MNNAFFGRSFLSSEETRSLWAMDSERILSDQLAAFSSYSAEWAEKAAREQPACRQTGPQPTEPTKALFAKLK